MQYAPNQNTHRSHQIEEPKPWPNRWDMHILFKAGVKHIVDCYYSVECGVIRTSYNLLKSEINNRVRKSKSNATLWNILWSIDNKSELFQVTISAMTCDTYMDKKTRCCTANLTIGPKAPKQSPFNSCLHLKGSLIEI